MYAVGTLQLRLAVTHSLQSHCRAEFLATVCSGHFATAFCSCSLLCRDIVGQSSKLLYTVEALQLRLAVAHSFKSEFLATACNVNFATAFRSCSLCSGHFATAFNTCPLLAQPLQNSVLAIVCSGQFAASLGSCQLLAYFLLLRCLSAGPVRFPYRGSNPRIKKKVLLWRPP